jgi:hypothetical protein
MIIVQNLEGGLQNLRGPARRQPLAALLATPGWLLDRERRALRFKVKTRILESSMYCSRCWRSRFSKELLYPNVKHLKRKRFG